jgi:hypothetical protein
MKLSVWDILAVLVLLAILCLVGSGSIIFFNPYSTLNPFPPPTEPVLITIPTATLVGKTLPPTWTPFVLDTVTPRPTWTMVPTSTIISLPTFTPYPSITPLPPLPSATSTPGEYHCKVTIQSPLNGGVLKTGADFDGKWTLTNDGSEFWDSGQTKARYLSGTKFQKGNDFVSFPKDVAPGGQTDLLADMVAPSDPGIYTAAWGLIYDDTTVCKWTFVVQVQK